MTTLSDTLADELSGANVALDEQLHNASVLDDRRALHKPHRQYRTRSCSQHDRCLLLTRALMPLLEAARPPRSCSQALRGAKVKPIGALMQCRNLPPRVICRCLPMSWARPVPCG